MKLRKIINILILSLWIILGYFLLQFYSPLRVLSPLYKINKTYYFFPQGWGFFTKSPDEELVRIYYSEQNILKRLDINNSSIDNYFGLSKKARFLHMESSFLYNEVIQNKNWVKKRGKITTDSFENLETDTLYYNNDYKTIKKKTTYYLVRYKPIPFEWSESHQKNYNPYEVIKVYVK